MNKEKKCPSNLSEIQPFSHEGIPQFKGQGGYKVFTSFELVL